MLYAVDKFTVSLNGDEREAVTTATVEAFFYAKAVSTKRQSFLFSV